MIPPRFQEILRVTVQPKTLFQSIGSSPFLNPASSTKCRPPEQRYPSTFPCLLHGFPHPRHGIAQWRDGSHPGDHHTTIRFHGKKSLGIAQWTPPGRCLAQVIEPGAFLGGGFRPKTSPKHRYRDLQAPVSPVPELCETVARWPFPCHASSRGRRDDFDRMGMGQTAWFLGSNVS